MLIKSLPCNFATTTTSPLLFSSSSAAAVSKLPTKLSSSFRSTTRRSLSFFKPPMSSWLGKLGFSKSPDAASVMSSSIPQGPDDDIPAPGQEFAQFGAGCFWGVELSFQRQPGVSKTEVGYSQGFSHNPSYNEVCSGTTNHNEIVRVQYDPKECAFGDLLDLFWSRHDPTTPNRQGNDVGSQYRSGIYYYTPEQEKVAWESMEERQKKLNMKIVTEILPAKKFYRAEEYHQQYLSKGGRFGFGFGFGQSAEKGCKDPIRCYG